jgi:hypothetical protein
MHPRAFFEAIQQPIAAIAGSVLSCGYANVAPQPPPAFVDRMFEWSVVLLSLRNPLIGFRTGSDNFAAILLFSLRAHSFPSCIRSIPFARSRPSRTALTAAPVRFSFERVFLQNFV